MVAPEIVAGRKEQIKGGCGDWLIVDIGIRINGRSCGVWYSPNKLDVVTFGELKRLVINKVQCCDQRPLNLLIEAPLSVALSPDGNPGRRKCDVYRKEYRDWHHGPGATTLLAAQFLLRALYDCPTRQREVRLFEGHVSFKSKKDKRREEKNRAKSHKKDVIALKNAVWRQKRTTIFCPEELPMKPNLKMESPFPFFDRELVPPVIRVNPAL